MDGQNYDSQDRASIPALSGKIMVKLSTLDLSKFVKVIESFRMQAIRIALVVTTVFYFVIHMRFTVNIL